MLAPVSPAFADVMNALTMQESSNRPGVAGLRTAYGQPLGLTQMLPATAQAQAAKLGLPWRPDLLSDTSDLGARYQRQLGASYLQEGYDRTGNMRDALRYFHGGPDKRLWGPRTNAYADAVLKRVYG